MTAVRRSSLALLLAAAAVAGAAVSVQNVRAQGLPIPGFGTTGTSMPLAIEADQGVEWRQNEQLYVAKGNATAKRGDTTVRADTLTAHYRRGAENRQEIYKIVADGAVKITTPKETITGDTAEYMVETGVFTLKGRPVKLDNGKGVLTAAHVVYDTKARVATVTGNATVTEDKKRVTANRFVAYFKEDAGKQALKRVDAIGNVVITTPTEIAKGDSGEYNAETQVATLTGNVRLTRGDNQLNGDRAEVNMKSGVSRLLADAGAPTANNAQPRGRVRVLIIPGQNPDSGKGPLDIPAPGADNKGTKRAEPKR